MKKMPERFLVPMLEELLPGQEAWLPADKLIVNVDGTAYVYRYTPVLDPARLPATAQLLRIRRFEQGLGLYLEEIENKYAWIRHDHKEQLRKLSANNFPDPVLDADFSSSPTNSDRKNKNMLYDFMPVVAFGLHDILLMDIEEALTQEDYGRAAKADKQFRLLFRETKKTVPFLDVATGTDNRAS